MKTSVFSLLFIGLTVFLTVAGQLFVKKGMLQLGPSPIDLSALPRFVFSSLMNPLVLIGLIFAFLAAISWTVGVSRSSLSFAYPFMGLAIVLVLALSTAVLGEPIPIGRWIGVAIVCAGLVVAASS